MARARTLHAFDDVFWGSGERRITVEATLDCEGQAWPASHLTSRDANARSLVRIRNRLWGWKIFVYLWWYYFVWSVSTIAWPTFDGCLYAIRGNLMTVLLTNVRRFTGSFLGWHPVGEGSLVEWCCVVFVELYAREYQLSCFCELTIYFVFSWLTPSDVMICWEVIQKPH